MSPANAPLAGYRILDLTAVVSGPLASMVLADQGAEVIKIEPPAGDYTRAAANRRGGESANFLNNNRGKRSVVLDLKRPEGREVALRLAGRADVLMQNFRPGVIERMGLDEAAVRAAAPNIVYCSISGFGEHGPYAARPVYDPLVQALSGLATVQGGSDEARPRLVRTILPDKLTGYLAAQAITAALLARERGGGGTHVRVSMLAAVVDFLWHSDMGSQTFVGDELPQAQAASFIDLIYETADRHISVAVQTDAQWRALCEVLERPQWLEDPRFATPALRQEHVDERLVLTQEVLRERSAGEWLERLQAAGVPCAPVLTRSEMIAHPQVQANALVLEQDHPSAGRLRQARPAATFDDAAAVGAPAPRLGEHGRAVLAEAGYGEAEIERLVAKGVLGEGPR
ncbi:CaiB/BaiF CoA transferase family protein [Spiribacter halobius]|uniref:Carnitine dehydratase n=1 Tax=Sediminicurvatus halobius TaxID=2182432 RepID=A0A2U2N5W8_9GAMM|nr:CoA transferase [Spiribacter halobius]PWG64369.1 carnitine dehydratase [Spiribacter halobius]UEX79283.1 CoA transferase [Spiribacter halobius]